jgi:uncharacterized protein YbjT (DUF2867 family)
VERVFLVSPAHARQVELQGNVIEASKRAGVSHIVKVASMETSLDSPVLLSRMHAQTERQLEASGIGQTYEITGPEALSFGDAAGILSEVLGKPVRYVDVPPAAARKSMLEAGIEEWLVNDLLLLMAWFSSGQAAVVTSTIASAAKIRPHTFRDFVRDYASLFGERLDIY